MRNGRLGEIIRFAAAGGVCFLIEFAVLVFLCENCGADTLIATPVAFLVSVAVNYMLCVRWVFTGTREQRSAAKAGFLVTSVIGLGLNELLMWLFRILFGETAVVITVFSFTVTMYMVNKVAATLIVMAWNYFTKRMILKRRA